MCQLQQIKKGMTKFTPTDCFKIYSITHIKHFRKVDVLVFVCLFCVKRRF